MLLARGVAGMSVAALASLASARAGVLFNSSEPTLRAAVPLAANVELAAVLSPRPSSSPSEFENSPRR